MLTKKNKIAVICGGWNCEKEVSLSSGQNVHKTLKDAGYNSILIDVDRDIVKKLYDIKPDIVFNALHGRFGEDGRMTAILDLLEIPVTHCSILPSAIAMNKIKTKELCSNIGGLGNIDFAILKKNNNAENKAILNKFPKPFVIKPVSEGSSCGIYMIDEDKY